MCGARAHSGDAVHHHRASIHLAMAAVSMHGASVHFGRAIKMRDAGLHFRILMYCVRVHVDVLIYDVIIRLRLVGPGNLETRVMKERTGVVRGARRAQKLSDAGSVCDARAAASVRPGAWARRVCDARAAASVRPGAWARGVCDARAAASVRPGAWASGGGDGGGGTSALGGPGPVWPLWERVHAELRGGRDAGDAE